MQHNLIITCEHASNKIPSAYKKFFKNQEKILHSHRGYDIGAYSVFSTLSKNLSCKHFYGRWSRLLIDLNRSLHHPSLFSNFMKDLSRAEKNVIINLYYQPHRDAIYQTIKKNHLKNISTLHFAIHSFTPQLHGVVRKADIGLLYDPKRQSERHIAFLLKSKILKENKDYIVRMNYPYFGTSDGLSTFLRKHFNEEYYLGIEIEINQSIFFTKQHNQVTNLLLKGIQSI